MNAKLVKKARQQVRREVLKMKPEWERTWIDEKKRMSFIKRLKLSLSILFLFKFKTKSKVEIR